jgi:hypothetical protein
MRRSVEREVAKQPAAWDLRQKGEKWFSEHRLPTLLQDNTVFSVMDQWQTDGKLLNLMVTNPFTGKPARPHLCTFLDTASTMPLGLSIDWSENSMMIQEAYLNAINFTNTIPQGIKQDNGSGFVSESTLGNPEIEELKGIYYRSGVQYVQMHRPYNAKGKAKIERTYGIFTGQFEAFLRSYTGRSVAGKPAHTFRNEKWLQKLENRQPLDLQELKLLLQDYILGQYASQPHPTIKDKSRGQVLVEGMAQLDPARRVRPEDYLYLMRSVERKVDNNGIKINGILYYDFALVEWVKQRVKIRYGMMEDRYVLVYSLDEQFICQATARMLTSPIAAQSGELEQGIVRHQMKAVRHTMSRYKKAVVNMQKLNDSIALSDHAQRSSLLMHGKLVEDMADLGIQQQEIRANDPLRIAINETDLYAEPAPNTPVIPEDSDLDEDSLKVKKPASLDVEESPAEDYDDKIDINLSEILG